MFLIFYQTLTWSTGSLTSVCDLFACVYPWETSVYSLIWRTLSFFQVKISKDICVCLDLFKNNNCFLFLFLFVANLLLPVHLNPQKSFIWTLVKCLILRLTLNSSLWQLYSAILCFWVNPLLSSRMRLSEWFYTAHFLKISKCLQCCLVVTWRMPHKRAAVLACFLCAPYNHALVTVSPYSKPHTKGVCVFNCNLPPALLAGLAGIFYCGNTGVK